MNILNVKPYYIKTQNEDTIFSNNNRFLEFYIDDVPLCEYIFKRYNFSVFDTAEGIGALGWFTNSFTEKNFLKQLLKIPLTEYEAKYSFPNASKEDIEILLNEYETWEIWIYLGACCGDSHCWGWNIKVIENIDTFTWEVDENIYFEFQKKAYTDTLKEVMDIIEQKDKCLKYAFDW